MALKHEAPNCGLFIPAQLANPATISFQFQIAHFHAPKFRSIAHDAFILPVIHFTTLQPSAFCLNPPLTRTPKSYHHKALPSFHSSHPPYPIQWLEIGLQRKYAKYNRYNEQKKSSLICLQRGTENPICNNAYFTFTIIYYSHTVCVFVCVCMCPIARARELHFCKRSRVQRRQHPEGVIMVVCKKQEGEKECERERENETTTGPGWPRRGLGKCSGSWAVGQRILRRLSARTPHLRTAVARVARVRNVQCASPKWVRTRGCVCLCVRGREREYASGGSK